MLYVCLRDVMDVVLSNVYKHTSSVDCTQNGPYNLKQYDHYKIKILNDLVHITLLLNENYACNSQYLRNIYIST